MENIVIHTLQCFLCLSLSNSAWFADAVEAPQIATKETKPAGPSQTRWVKTVNDVHPNTDGLRECTKDAIKISKLDDQGSSLSPTVEEDFQSFRYGEYLEYWRKGFRNSVTPQYKDLRDEMTRNKVLAISKKQYDELHQKAEKLLKLKPLYAKRVGNNNKICVIEEGSLPSVEHIIALLMYTDFTSHQREFKKQCRRKSANESLKELVDRNSEIYHWCKLIKELCIFYGEIMGEDEVLYTGIGETLLFDSLCTRFECPISTSTKLRVAKTFGSIILKFKRGSARTKIFDVTEFSNFGKKSHLNEHERLVAGSTLNIVDIVINGTSQTKYVSVFKMFEQIIYGHFIEWNEQTAVVLQDLAKCLVSPLKDTLNKMFPEQLSVFLVKESYDSDSIIDDVEDKDSSLIYERFGSSIFSKVEKTTKDYRSM